MNCYSSKWGITTSFSKGCNIYSLVDAVIFWINIFSNKHSFHIHITIIKIKNGKKKITYLSLKFKNIVFKEI